MFCTGVLLTLSLSLLPHPPPFHPYSSLCTIFPIFFLTASSYYSYSISWSSFCISATFLCLLRNSVLNIIVAFHLHRLCFLHLFWSVLQAFPYCEDVAVFNKLNNYVKKSKEQNSSWRPRSSSNCQAIAHILYNLEVHYRVKKRAICSYSEPDQSQFTAPRPVSWISILILSSYLRLCFSVIVRDQVLAPM